MPLIGLIEEFPFSSSRIVTVPSIVDPKFGIEQLNSYHAPALVVDIPNITPDPQGNPHLAFFASAAIRVEPYLLPCRAKTDNSASPVEVNGTLNRCGFWLTEASSPGGGTLPSDFDWEIRAVVGRCTPEIVASGTVSLKSFQQKGLIAQVSGILCTQFELWTRIPGVGDLPMRVGIDIVADRFHGQRFEVIKGAIST